MSECESGMALKTSYVCFNNKGVFRYVLCILGACIPWPPNCGHISGHMSAQGRSYQTCIPIFHAKHGPNKLKRTKYSTCINECVSRKHVITLDRLLYMHTAHITISRRVILRPKGVQTHVQTSSRRCRDKCSDILFHTIRSSTAAVCRVQRANMIISLLECFLLFFVHSCRMHRMRARV
jgi:hypothetical protein